MISVTQLENDIMFHFPEGTYDQESRKQVSLFQIDVKNDCFYLHGERFKTTSSIRKYDRRYTKQGNYDKKHVEILELKNQKYVFVFKVSRGFDGRIFFAQYDEKAGVFRQSAVKRWSYFHNRYENKKEFYEDDLYVPKKVWKEGVLQAPVSDVQRNLL